MSCERPRTCLSWLVARRSPTSGEHSDAPVKLVTLRTTGVDHRWRSSSFTLPSGGHAVRPQLRGSYTRLCPVVHALPRSVDAAVLTDVNAGGRLGREGAAPRVLVGRRFHDLLAGLFDADERPANTRHRPQVGKLAQEVVEGVQAVAKGDCEQVGPVFLVEHVGVGL